ncbi:hypothetical protein FDP41_000677 [Naegleria fowleri]|uniref:B box-type domain-containing protein n=1 Tax=Naegleria fowleri TaxID=5763 RepID=A0A6A5CHN9_NAEFO|nr:uncharacterized protein FDP41_000677 [Naegleria fowleri]KAF0984778.1 hypothetical protein FDP41_000677 [Naegleria fowleri]
MQTTAKPSTTPTKSPHVDHSLFHHSHRKHHSEPHQEEATHSSQQQQQTTNSFTSLNSTLWCSICLKKAEEHIPAITSCQECQVELCKFHTKTHFKKHESHVSISLINNEDETRHQYSNAVLNGEMNRILTEGNNSLHSSQSHRRHCVIHSSSINTFCKTCEQLICAACSVHSHKGHDLYLIDSIEKEEREKLNEQLQLLKKEIIVFENEHSLDDATVNNELEMIEEMNLRLKQQGLNLFEKLKTMIETQQEKLNQSIDEMCENHKCIIHHIVELKVKLMSMLGEFDQLHQLSGLEMMEKKLVNFKKVDELFQELKSRCKFENMSELHGYELVDTKSSFKIIEKEIDKFSNIVHSIKPKTTPRKLDFVSNLTESTVSNDSLSNPYDVKLSYACNCILISDYFNSRIQIYELETKQFKTTIKTISRPHCLCIETNYNSHFSDALLVGCSDHSVYKYDLKSLVDASVNKRPHHDSLIWKQSEQLEYPAGMLVTYQYLRNLSPTSPVTSRQQQDTLRIVYVCDYTKNCIHLIRLQDGEIICRFGLNDGIVLQGPWGIDMNEHGEIIVGETGFNRIQFLKPDGMGSYVSLKSFGQTGNGNGQFNFLRGVVYDRACKQILACDFSGRRIQIFDRNGEYLTSYYDRVQGPYNCCIHELTREVFVADYSKKRIFIFK